jgi:hypothetical protein
MSIQQYEDVWAEAAPETVTDRTPVPEGSYDATVRGVKLKEWNDGTYSVEWEFAIVGGPYNGRITWANAGLDNAKIGKTKGQFQMLGIQRPTLTETIAAGNTIVGRGVKISVSAWNGKLYTHLNDLNDAVTVSADEPIPAPVPVFTPVPVTNDIPF